MNYNKKAGNAGAWVVGFVFFTALLVFQINVSTVSKLSVLHSRAATGARNTGHEQGQVTERPKLDSASKRAPQTKFIEQEERGKEASKSKTRDTITCDRSHATYDFCTINGPTLLDPTTSTFHLLNPPTATPSPPHKIRPYPRKWENHTMSVVREFTLTEKRPTPTLRCDVDHSVPALVFSVGFYTNNFFHEFNDGFIPLFITARTVFRGGDTDFVLVIDRATDRWLRKYAELLRTLSRHPIVNLANATVTHCFTSASIGLISHGFMTINPNLRPHSTTFSHFRKFLDEAYQRVRSDGGARKSTVYGRAPPFRSQRPRLVLAGRSGGHGRVILNQKEVVEAAEAVGFEVAVFEPTHRTALQEAYELVNSSHALVGVHGAALTHLLFLRRGAAFGQVVPIGAEWVGQVCFAGPTHDLGLKYVEYKVRVEESSLVEKYGREDVLLRDPVAARGGGWSDKVMAVYLKEQNVKLDMGRLRGFLEEVYEKAKKFMETENEEEEGPVLN